MSAYNQITTQMTEMSCLKKALEKTPRHRSTPQGKKAVTFQPVLHNIATKLEGYHGDKRVQTAELVIPRAQVGSASNEIGFKKQTDGTIKAIISDFDQGQGYNAEWLKKLATTYNEVRVEEKLDMQDFGVIERTALPNGKVRLQFAQRGA